MCSCSLTATEFLDKIHLTWTALAAQYNTYDKCIKHEWHCTYQVNTVENQSHMSMVYY